MKAENINRAELTGVTALRFFAALFVLLFHSRFFAEGSWLEIPIFALFSYGWLGVDIFFVLSGFIMAYVYAEKLQIGGYLVRRLARIYPLYLATTLAAILTIELLGAPAAFGAISPFDVWMNLLMLQGWYAEWRGSINFVSWSVSAEFAAYLMFPLVLTLVKFLPVNWIGILVPVLAYSLFGGFAPLGLEGPVNKCIFEFTSGVMLFIWWKRQERMAPWMKHVALVSLLSIIALGPWMQFVGLALPDRYLAVFALPIVAWAASWRTDNSILLLGGRASYSIYLVHGVVYMVLRRMIELGHMPGMWSLLLFWMLSLSVALLTYRWIEHPARHWIVRKWSQPPKPA